MGDTRVAVRSCDRTLLELMAGLVTRRTDVPGRPWRRGSWMLAVVLVSAAGPDYVGAQALSIEASLRDVRISEYDRPDISPDGRRVAYVTTEGPPETRPLPTSSSEGGVALRAPSSLRGARLHIASIATRDEVEVNPGDWANWSPSFSPDGRSVAFFSDAGGRIRLWIADATTGDARSVSDAPIFVRMWTILDRARWTANGSAVYVLIAADPSAETGPPGAGPIETVPSAVKVEASGDERAALVTEMEDREGQRRNRSGVVSLDRVQISDGTHRSVYVANEGEQIQAFALSPSESWIAYAAVRSATERVYELTVLPVSGGTAHTLGEVQQIVYDGPASSEMFGSVFQWSPARDHLVFARDSALWLVEFTEGGPSPPTRLGADLGKISAPTSAATDRFDQPTFTADGGAVIARLPVSDTIILGVFALDGSGSRRLPVASGLRFLGLATMDGSVLWQPAPGTAVVVASDLITGETVVIRIDLATGRTATLARERSDIRFMAGADPGSMVAEFTDATTPPNLYAVDGSLRDRRRITVVDPGLDGLASGRSVTFATRAPSYDGSMITLKTSVLLPPGVEPGTALPAIVYIYPDNEMSKRANAFGGGRLGGAELGLFWTSRGYAVVFPDLTPMTPILEGGGGAIREIIDYLVPQLYRASELGYVDIDRLVLTGFSYGGYGTVAAVTRTNLFRAAVAYASAPLDLFSTSWTEWPGVGGRIGVGASPWGEFKEYLDNSPFHHAESVRTPLLLIHGTADNVPPATSEQMFRGLQQLGRTAQLALYEGEPHYVGSWTMGNAIDVTQRVLDFVSRYSRSAFSERR
jgi:dipeptidyl aminopeptidase/acylaminoacyl peptidase